MEEEHIGLLMSLSDHEHLFMDQASQRPDLVRTNKQTSEQKHHLTSNTWLRHEKSPDSQIQKGPESSTHCSVSLASETGRQRESGARSWRWWRSELRTGLQKHAVMSQKVCPSFMNYGNNQRLPARLPAGSITTPSALTSRATVADHTQLLLLMVTSQLEHDRGTNTWSFVTTGRHICIKQQSVCLVLVKKPGLQTQL